MADFMTNIPMESSRLRIAWRKVLRFFGRGEKIYYDLWHDARPAQRLADLGFVVVQARMTASSYLSLRGDLPLIDATRARFGLGPLFPPAFVERVEGQCRVS